MTSEKIKWGILGPGKIAGKFCRGLQHVENAEVYAIGSRSKSRAEEFAKEFKAEKIYSSYEELVKDEEVDVIYVATPHSFHFEHTLLCLKNKKAVLCEKPFGMNKQEVEKMIATAKKENVFLMEAMWTHFLPHFRFAIDLVRSEKYGKLKQLEADFGFAAPFDEEHRLYNKALGGGSLLDIGIYPVFMALSALGKPEKLAASAKFCDTAVDEDCNITFEYPEAVKAELHSNIGKETPTTAKLQFENATVTLNSRFHEPTSVHINTDQQEESIEFGVEANGYNFEAEHVQQMLLEGRTESTEMTFEKSLELIDMLDQIRKEIELEY